MNTGLFSGVPDDFGEGSTPLHPDLGTPLQPLCGAGRRERDQENPCSCARMKYSMAGATTLTCPRSLQDCAISHAEQGAYGRNCCIKLLNLSPSLHHLPPKLTFIFIKWSVFILLAENKSGLTLIQFNL